MDPEVLRLRAQVDQTRSEIRAIMAAIPQDDVTRLIRTCARGCLGTLSPMDQRIVGMLAVIAIFDLAERKQE